jgi:hypothetical protein
LILIEKGGKTAFEVFKNGQFFKILPRSGKNKLSFSRQLFSF